MDSSIKFSVNYTNQVCAARPPSANGLGWNADDFKDKPAPSINSETGEKMLELGNQIIPEVAEHACYLIQTIKIGKSEALVFFDRGANIHIIDGSLAAGEDLQQVSSSQTSLTVVGGKKIKSQHGTYRFNLGPGEKGEFHLIVCVGMDDVTVEFGTYDLSEICEEFKINANGDEIQEILPNQVGGSRVHLLLGIKNTNLDPVLIKKLPSGIGVYRSPFKDVYGSRIIFAGPHKSFSGSNPMSNAVVPMGTRLQDEFNQGYEERGFSMVMNKFFNKRVQPHPISEYDVIESNGFILEQVEDILDDQLLQLMDDEDLCSKNRNKNDLLSRDDPISCRGKEIRTGEKVMKSGEKLHDKTGSDGESLELLGYEGDWEIYLLYPGLEEMNMDGKMRGEKKSNLDPGKFFTSINEPELESVDDTEEKSISF